MGEGGEHGKLVVICMPERLGLCTYMEEPEQSLGGAGGRRRELEGMSCESLLGLLSCTGILFQLAAVGMFFLFLP